MGALQDKAKGVANEAAGKAKQRWGDMTDDPDAKAEGAAQELKGKGQKLKGDVKDKVDQL